MYLTIDGIDCTGKSTLIEKLRNGEVMRNFTKEPYTDAMRELLTQETDDEMLQQAFSADRKLHMLEVIIPMCEKGEDIISDRSVVSGIAYEAVTLKRDLNDVMEERLRDVDGIIPDLTIILTVDEHEFKNRMNLRQEDMDMIESKGWEFFEEVQENLIKVAQAIGEFAVINTTYKSPSQVYNTVVDLIKYYKER